ncbi:pyruvate kinase [Planctomycetes bacterium K23_9]|uniref:Pyruvate kinase n=1 Tax=Stieleria marina TaxID=1930275 RepID=A0A517NQZ4_9BACT|nr:Pyruvate kinase [Planctomycetes bacterium K23_9]
MTQEKSNAGAHRHTKIIATIGPATESALQLRELILSGVDVVRLNMAHGTGQWAREVVARIRQVSAEVSRHVAVMMDIKGPEIRTGVVDTPIELKTGDRVFLMTDPSATALPSPTAEGKLVYSVTVNYPALGRDIEIDAIVLVDSGLLRMKVLSIDENGVLCEVLTDGMMGSRRHINLPGVEVSLPALTEKDVADLKDGVAAGIDFVALSFVRHGSDVLQLQELLTELGSTAKIIAKIEEHTGVANMQEIVRESDAIMVARGDLGIEIDYHRLPLIQSELVVACQREGKPVIIATHLLESMIVSPMPTRAEISDVCNAVREQADAVMLSGETTTGAYPIESVEVLKNIICSIEPSVSAALNDQIVLREPKAKMLRSAAVLAQDLKQSGIIVFTRSGFLAYVLAALRPRGVPIFAFTDQEDIFRHCLLPWGVEPFLLDFSEDPELTIGKALACLKEGGWVHDEDWLVVITNALANDKIIDSLQLRQVQPKEVG